MPDRRAFLLGAAILATGCGPGASGRLKGTSITPGRRSRAG